MILTEGDPIMDTSSSSDSEEDFHALRAAPIFRPRINWDYLSRANFIERFRMSPDQAEILLRIIGPDLEPVQYTNHALNVKQKLCCALRFFGTNGPYFEVGDAEHVSKSTVYRCVYAVTESISRRLQNIKWPADEMISRQISLQFFNKSKGANNQLPGFVHCIGALDGSLIKIVSPSVDENQFVDRKGNHSLNAMGVCGPDLKFFSFSIKFPGSVNDARVFRRSGLFELFENGFRPFNGAVIVADAAYPQLDYLVPTRNFIGEWQPFYEAHARCRSKIENAWALFKNRFACLKGPLRFKNPTDAARVIKALAFLHNFLIETRDSNAENDPADLDMPIEDDGEDEEEVLNIARPIEMNNRMQNLLQQFNLANNLQ